MLSSIRQRSQTDGNTRRDTALPQRISMSSLIGIFMAVIIGTIVLISKLASPQNEIQKVQLFWKLGKQKLQPGYRILNTLIVYLMNYVGIPVAVATYIQGYQKRVKNIQVNLNIRALGAEEIQPEQEANLIQEKRLKMQNKTNSYTSAGIRLFAYGLIQYAAPTEHYGDLSILNIENTEKKTPWLIVEHNIEPEGDTHVQYSHTIETN